MFMYIYLYMYMYMYYSYVLLSNMYSIMYVDRSQLIYWWKMEVQMYGKADYRLPSICYVHVACMQSMWHVHVMSYVMYVMYPGGT